MSESVLFNRARRTIASSVVLVVGLVGAAGCGDEGPRQEANTPPTIESMSAPSQTLTPDEQVRVDVTAADADVPGPPPEAGLAEGLAASWRVDGKGWSIDGDGGEAYVTAPGAYERTGTVVVEVADGAGATATDELVFETIENEPPRITSATATPTPVEPGGEIELAGRASDPKGDELDYQWSAPDGWTLQSDTEKNTMLDAPDEPSTRAEVELVVEDEHGGRASTTVEVETGGDGVPTVASMTANPPQLPPDGSSQVIVDAADPEGGELTYDWSVSDPWTIHGDGREVTVVAPGTHGERTVVSVEVADPRGQTASAEVVVETRTASGPVINGVTSSPPTFPRGGTGQITVNATDPDGQPLDYSWSVSGKKWTLDENGSRADLTAPDEPSLRTQVEVEVADPGGRTAQASTVVSTRSNRAPSLTRVTASPGVVDPKGTVSVEAEASDPEGDSLTYNWKKPKKWSVVGGSGRKIDLKAPGTFGRQDTVEVTVEDGNGGRATGTATVATRANKSPSIASVTASPTVVDAGGESTLQVLASDPNGDSLTYTWSKPGKKWKKVGGSGERIEVKAPSTYGLQGRFEVDVSDGHGHTVSGAVVVDTHDNRPPVISAMIAGKSKLEPGKSTTVEVRASDPDGDPLSYKWIVPKKWKGSSQSKSIGITAPNKLGVSNKLKVEVSDGTSTVRKAITVETITNTPPSIKSLSAKPSPVLQNGTTQLTVDATDPDGDPLKYKWSVNKQNWPTSGAGKQIGLTSPNNGQTQATVSVTVTDSWGATATSQKTVKTKACASNKGNCDGQISNGCEVDLTDDDNNCGSCGNACSGRKYCTSSKCVSAPTLSKVRSASPSRANWLSSNPYNDFHDGGFVYSSSQDALYAIYGNDSEGRNVYLVDHKNQTSSRVARLNYDRHGSHPVIDQSGGWVYFPPSQYTRGHERVKIGGSHTRQRLSTAPHDATFSRGAFNNGKLWIVLDDSNLHSYDPSSDSWNDTGTHFRRNGMVVANSNAGQPDIYIWIEDYGYFYKYDTSNGNRTRLADFTEHEDDLGGNGQMEYIPAAQGAQYGFVYTVNGCDGDPRLYSIANDQWYRLNNPKRNDGCSGHATYDPKARRLYITGRYDRIWYYQY